MTACGACGAQCAGFFTDREKRKVWGMGILYLCGFPICLLMLVVGGLRAAPPGEPNPSCPAEPNLPWFLIIGGTGITVILLCMIGINKCTRLDWSRLFSPWLAFFYDTVNDEFVCEVFEFSNTGVLNLFLWSFSSAPIAMNSFILNHGVFSIQQNRI